MDVSRHISHGVIEEERHAEVAQGLLWLAGSKEAGSVVEGLCSVGIKVDRSRDVLKGFYIATLHGNNIIRVS